MKITYFVLLVLVGLALAAPARAIKLPGHCPERADTLTLVYTPDSRSDSWDTASFPGQRFWMIRKMGGWDWVLVDNRILGVIVDASTPGVVRYLRIGERCRKSVLKFARRKFPDRNLVFYDE